MPDLPSKTQQEQIIKDSEKRFKYCEDAERELREMALDDLKFRAGEQWPDWIKRKREGKRKAVLTLNYLATREKQVLNEQRQNRSAIKVSPVDGDADPDTADVLGGIIRHIEYDSNADDIWDVGLASATRIGFGFVGLITEFESPTSFNQVIKMRGFRNPFQVYLDPSASMPDRSDAKFGYVFETLTREEYEEEYPDTELCSIDTWGRTGDHDPEWLGKDSVRIAEYFYCEYKDDNLLQVRNRMGETRALLETDYEQLTAGARKLLKVVDKRETKVPKIRWCKHNPFELLSYTDWPGKWIPIVPILGDELMVDGKLILEGMVRHAKDPMRMQNYMASELVQTIALGSKAPMKVPKDTYANYKAVYDNANNEDFAVLPYDAWDVNGRQLPPPERDGTEPPIQAISQARAQFADDFRQITGIHEAQFGAPSNEKSGSAIKARKAQGELSNFHYVDNCTRSRRYLGRQLLDLIPKVISEAQMIRIIGQDGAQKVVQVNKEFQLADGSKKVYDLALGTYDLTISNQPSYQTRKQAAVDNMLNLVGNFPQLAQIAGDLIVGAMDFPDHEKLAERIKKTLPPGLADDPTDTDPKIQLQQAQQKLQALGQQHDQLVQVVNKLQDEKMGKVTENEGRLAIEKLHAETQITVAEITTKAQNEMKRAQFEFDMWKLTHSSAHDAASQAVDAQNQQQQQLQDQSHEADMAASGQVHEADMAAQQAAQQKQAMQ